MSHLRKRNIEKINIVHIHLAYEELRDRFLNLSEILNLTWKDEDGSDLVSKIKTAFDNARTENKVGPTKRAIFFLIYTRWAFCFIMNIMHLGMHPYKCMYQ